MIRSQFDHLINIVEDARKLVDSKARTALNEGDNFTVLKSFDQAAKTIRDRYPPYKMYLNQTLCDLLDKTVRDLSPLHIKGKMSVSRTYKHCTHMQEQLHHVKGVIDEYRRSAESSHLFDDSGITEIDDRLVFIAMPYEPHDEMMQLSSVIKHAIYDFRADLNPKRADEIPGDKFIYHAITKSIRKCTLFVAILHGANPNVYFELGYARALQKKVLPIAGSPADLKFDIKLSNCIIESDEGALRAHVGDWLRESL